MSHYFRVRLPSYYYYFRENFTSIQTKKILNLDQCRTAGSDLKLICQPESPQAPLYVDRRSLCEQAQLTEVLLLQRKKRLR